MGKDRVSLSLLERVDSSGLNQSYADPVFIEGSRRRVSTILYAISEMSSERHLAIANVKTQLG
jgi:hypothetical protein